MQSERISREFSLPCMREIRVCARIYFSFATIFANLIFFCAIFLNLEPDFWPFFAPKSKARFWAFLLKRLLSLTLNSFFLSLNTGGLFYTH